MSKKKVSVKGLVKIIVAVSIISAVGFGGLTKTKNQFSLGDPSKAEIVNTNFSDEAKDGLIETSYDLFISNSPNRDPKHFTEAKPGEVLTVKFDESKLSKENYASMYTKEGVASESRITKELGILNALKDSEVEVYVIYSKVNSIRANYPDAYKMLYKGTLSNLSIRYEIEDPSFTEAQISKMPQQEQERRQNECEFNLVFRFSDDILSIYQDETVIIPLKAN